MERETLKGIYKYEDKPISLVDPSIVEGCICDEVYPEEWDDIKKLGEAMIKLCVEQGGLGLSAPQVGVMKKMFVWNNSQNQFQIVVNPYFTPDGKKTNVVEGCLTYPGKHFFLKRFKSGNARSDILDPNDTSKFKRSFRKLSGERALVWQHESDHLEGKTIAMIGMPFDTGKKDA